MLQTNVFGVMTVNQVGYVPKVQLNYLDENEDDESEEKHFFRDTFVFRQVQSDGTVSLKIDRELEKALIVDDCQRKDIRGEEVEEIVSPGTINQIEIFHSGLIGELYKMQRKADYEQCANSENAKKYFIVPLKLKIENQGQADLYDLLRSVEYNYNDEQIKFGTVVYEIDKDLLKKVEKIRTKGYENVQDSILEWKKKLGFTNQQFIDELR